MHIDALLFDSCRGGFECYDGEAPEGRMMDSLQMLEQFGAGISNFWSFRKLSDPP